MPAGDRRGLNQSLYRADDCAYLLDFISVSCVGLCPQSSSTPRTATGELPVKLEHLLNESDEIEEALERIFRSTDFLYLGRGINFPVAPKRSEAERDFYIHAEGYPAGEMKHGTKRAYRRAAAGLVHQHAGGKQYASN